MHLPTQPAPIVRDQHCAFGGDTGLLPTAEVPGQFACVAGTLRYRRDDTDAAGVLVPDFSNPAGLGVAPSYPCTTNVVFKAPVVIDKRLWLV